ncbi:MAG: M4 family metallopeptidase [Bacteroidales bacterium]
MKKHYFFSLVLLLSGFISFGQEFSGSAAEKRVNGAQMVRYRQNSALPDYIELRNQAWFSVDNLSSWLNKNCQVNSDLSVEPINVVRDKSGDVHQRYQQYYHNVPLFDAVFSTHSKNNQVYSLNGRIRQDVNPVNLVVLSESQALVFALKKLPAEVYKWEIPGNESFLKSFTNNPEATYFPKGKLVLYPDLAAEENSYRFAYKFNVYASKPLMQEDIYIDAQTGDVLFQNNRIHHSDSTGVAYTKYSGTQEIKTSYVNETYRLREIDRGQGVETYNMNQGTDYGSAVDFTDPDNIWNNFNPLFDEVATDAHWASEMTYDYFWLIHGRNSIDDNGFKLVSYVHYDMAYANAFWDGSVMTYGDGDGNWSPLTTVDICAHEITHGLTTFTSDLIYSYESGALNEAYSDIFGASVEFYAKPATANWTMGEDIGGIIRNMGDPNSMGDPDTYLGNNWYTGSGDNGGVHTNSNVLNYWFYLATEGGNGVNDNGDSYNVTGIGILDAAAIAFRTNTIYLQPDYNYADARFYSLKSAQDLFGGCSPAVETVANAFYAVGVGGLYDPTVIASFEANVTSICQLPAEITFTNTSNNGSSYLWDFGDGTTDTLADPVHIYTSEGTYTVTLQVDGGPCGADTLEIQSYISIDTPDTPVVTSASNCGGPASLTLTAIAPDSILWYLTPVGGIPFHTGTTYTTPVLNQSAHYYVDNSIMQADVNGGKPDNSGGGSYFNFSNPHYLEFDVYTPAIIKTVKVYAQGNGNRTIRLLNSNDVELQSATINIPDGVSTITLNFPVPVGNGFKLEGPGNPNLYRNNGGTNYPYIVGSVLTITTSSAGEGRYYYFYDWVVGQQPCTSERLKVSAFINYGDPVASFSTVALPSAIQFTSTSTDANEYLWDFGDGNTSTLENPLHHYANLGQYTVTLTVTNSCGTHTFSQQVTVLATGIEDASQAFSVSVSPVPSKDKIQIVLESAELSQARLLFYDMLGNVIYNEMLGNITGNWSKTINISRFEQGVYIMGIQHDHGTLTRRFIVQ